MQPEFPAATIVQPHTHAELEALRALKHLGAACGWACDLRLPGKTSDEVADLLGIQPATWSRIRNGKPHGGAVDPQPEPGKKKPKKAPPANPSDELILRIRQVTGSEGPTLWLLMQQGYDPTSLRGEHGQQGVATTDRIRRRAAAAGHARQG